ncbi:hypothetical protein GCM10009660_12750 [Catellatospora bangladeshensis]
MCSRYGAHTRPDVPAGAAPTRFDGVRVGRPPTGAHPRRRRRADRRGGAPPGQATEIGARGGAAGT